MRQNGRFDCCAFFQCCIRKVLSTGSESIYPSQNLDQERNVWGDPTNDLTIQLEGHATPVTSNLYSALKHLRQTKTERTLWIDALCINQGDNNEQFAQVALMQHVYWQASAVVVFFGDSWEELMLFSN